MYAAVVAMMGSVEGAQDILQEANAALLEKAKEYDPTRPFIPWAIGFVRNQVLAWRKKQSRDRLVLNDELYEAVANRLAADLSQPNRRLEALEQCLNKLPISSRELITARYGRGESVQVIAARSGQSSNVVSVSLFRVRQALLDCIRASLAAEDEQ